MPSAEEDERRTELKTEEATLVKEQKSILGFFSEKKKRSGWNYRCQFTALQFASVLQHGVDNISRSCSLPVCWSHIQQVLYTNQHTQ